REVLRLEALPSFEKVRETRGFRAFLAEAIKELKQNAVRPEEFPRRILQVLEESGGCRRRHEDLGRGLGSYQRRLAAIRRLDQEDLELAALARMAAEGALLAEKRVLLVDGFHDFTPVQLRILALLARRIPESLVTLSFDPLRPDAVPFRASHATRGQ